MRKFKDFATKIEIDYPSGEKGEVKWNIQDVFEMLDYLSEEIEKIKILTNNK